MRNTKAHLTYIFYVDYLSSKSIDNLVYFVKIGVQTNLNKLLLSGNEIILGLHGGYSKVEIFKVLALEDTSALSVSSSLNCGINIDKETPSCVSVRVVVHRG